jgi:hypothetical protein
MSIGRLMRRVAAKRLFGHNLGVWLLWVIGAAILLSAPMAIADPGIWMLVLDPELLALMIAVALASVRIGAGLYLSRLSPVATRLTTKNRAV